MYQTITIDGTSLVCQFDVLGGFTVVDTESGLTSYAYPSSTHATNARKRPGVVAKQMIRGELHSCRLSAEIEKMDRVRERQAREAAGMPVFDRPLRVR